MKIWGAYLVVCLTGAIVLSGCVEFGGALHQIPHSDMKTRFDPDEVAYVFKAGSAIVKGRVSINDGLDGKFAKVRLVPIAPYSTEVMGFLFQGRKTYFEGRQVDNLDPRYPQSMRYATADDVGNYKFYGVSGGNYYVYATVSDQRARVYFAVMEMISLTDGQTLAIDLDGN